jgi:hypothetical protein
MVRLLMLYTYSYSCNIYCFAASRDGSRLEEPAVRSELVEKPEGMTNINKKHVVTVSAREFVRACHLVGNNSCAALGHCT